MKIWTMKMNLNLKNELERELENLDLKNKLFKLTKVKI